jgi:hypothetical protein
MDPRVAHEYNVFLEKTRIIENSVLDYIESNPALKSARLRFVDLQSNPIRTNDGLWSLTDKRRVEGRLPFGMRLRLPQIPAGPISRL